MNRVPGALKEYSELLKKRGDTKRYDIDISELNAIKEQAEKEQLSRGHKPVIGNYLFEAIGTAYKVGFILGRRSVIREQREKRARSRSNASE